MEVKNTVELFDELDRQTLEAYGKGVGGSEVLESIRARHPEEEKFKELIAEAIELRAETEKTWDSIDSIALGGEAETYFIPPEKEPDEVPEKEKEERPDNKGLSKKLTLDKTTRGTAPGDFVGVVRLSAL